MIPVAEDLRINARAVLHEQIADELRTQYLLAYYPRNVPLNKDRFHKLEVRLTRPDLRAFARNGYYGEVEGGRAASPQQRVTVSPGGQQLQPKKQP